MQGIGRKGTQHGNVVLIEWLMGRGVLSGFDCASCAPRRPVLQQGGVLVRDSELTEQWKQFYRSSDWGMIKNAIRRRSSGVCEYCEIRPMHTAHHRCYREPIPPREVDLDDLMAICEQCHDYLHREPGAAVVALEFAPGSPGAMGDDGFTRRSVQPGEWKNSLRRGAESWVAWHPVIEALLWYPGETPEEAKREHVLLRDDAGELIKYRWESVRPMLEPGEPHVRRTHCYSCWKKIDDAGFEKCPVCNWIKCPCGACDCNRDGGAVR